MASAARPIVFVSGSDPLTTPGGHHSYVLAHALAAGRIGFAPHIFCFAPRTSIEVTDFGVLHRIAAPVRKHLLTSFHAPFLSAAIVKFLAGISGPHIVHSFSVWAGAGAAASHALTRRGVEAIPMASAYTLLKHEYSGMLAGLSRDHGALERLRYRAWYLWVCIAADRLARRGYANSRVILVNYESVRKLLLGACPPGLDIRLLPYTSPTAFRSTADGPHLLPEPIAQLRPADAPLVVAVSRQDPRKGVNVLLAALAALAARGVDFRAALVGPGRLLMAHRKLMERLSLTDRVVIPGRVEDPFAYLRHADIFVIPSLEEGSGSVALVEALQAGVAIVASRCDGIPEDLVEGDDALLVHPGDSGALEAALAELLTNAPLRRRLSVRARQVYEQRFSPEALVAALKSTYAEFGVVP